MITIHAWEEKANNYKNCKVYVKIFQIQILEYNFTILLLFEVQKLMWQKYKKQYKLCRRYYEKITQVFNFYWKIKKILQFFKKQIKVLNSKMERHFENFY